MASLKTLGQIVEYMQGLMGGSSAASTPAEVPPVPTAPAAEPTALADAYAMIKVLCRRQGIDRIGLVLNQTREDEAFGIFERLSMLTSRFLSVVLELVGSVPPDPHVPESVKMQQPVLLAHRVLARQVVRAAVAVVPRVQAHLFLVLVVLFLHRRQCLEPFR